MEHKPKVLVTGPRMRPEVLAALKEHCRVTQWTASAVMPFEEFAKAAPMHDVVVRAFRSPFGTREAEVCQSHIKAVLQAFVGYEGVDIDALTQCGIPFCNAASPSSYTVAEMALTLILASQRRLPASMEEVKDGTWTPGRNPVLGHNLMGRTAGIFGMGHIGGVLAGMLRAMGMTVLYYNRHPRTDDSRTGAVWTAEEELLKQSDMIINILPASPATHHMMDLSFFRKMKRNALFVNVGRGDTVVTADLVQALREGIIGSAALDVCDPEPVPPDHPLMAMDNVIVTPHMASDTYEVVDMKVEEMIKNVFRAVRGEELTDCVNPEVYDQAAEKAV